MLGPRYRLIEALGAGGQGEVWRVEDLHHAGARRILKALVSASTAAPVELAHEFERLAGLDHPALPRVRDLGVLEDALGDLPAGTPYFTSDEVDGIDLLTAVAGAGLDERPRLGWIVAADVASALAHVHAAGLCHCDVTPANVLVVGRGDQARAVLIDLGLSAMRGALGAARGTLAYMAPEALTGVIDPRGDLYGLGATLHHALAGAPPFAAADPAALVRAIVRTPAPALDPAAAPGLAALIARLLAKAPEQRPASALAVFDELADAAAALSQPVRPRPRPAVRPPRVAPPVRGADALLLELGQALEACRLGTAGGAIVVTGPAGADVAGAVALAVQRHQLEAAAADPAARAPVQVIDGTLDAVATTLQLAPIAGDDTGRAAAAQVIRAAAAQARTATVLEVTGDERAPFAVAALAGVVGPGLIIVLAEGELGPVPAGVLVLRRGAVAAAEIGALAGAMLGRSVPPAWAAGLARASGGLPAVAAAIVHALALEGDPLAADPERDADGASLDEVQRRQIGACGAAARAVAEAVAAWDGRARTGWIAATVDAAEPDLAGRAAGLAALTELGLVRRSGDELVMRAGLVARIQAATAPARAEALHTAAVAVARRLELPAPVWAAHLAALPPRAEHVAPLCLAAEDRLRRGQPRAALALAEAAARLPGAGGARAALLAAHAAMLAGAYDLAIASAERAVAELDAPPASPGDRSRVSAAQLVLARARQRAGDLAGAEALLTGLARELGGAAEVAGPLARLLVAAGRHEEAERVVAGAEPLPPTAAGALCAEASGTARLYRGDPAGADQRFGEAEVIAQATGDLALAGRARALRGMAAQAAGELARASDCYREAATLSRAGGDVHAAAIAELNRATTLAERGRHGDALPVLAAATAELAALGKVAELAAAELNRGLSLLAVGQVDPAAAAARAARTEADPERSPHLAVFAWLLTGDVARRQRDRAGAAAAYRTAAELAGRTGAGDRGHALRGLAETLAESDPVAAARALAEAAGLDASDDDRDRTLLTRGRLALAQPGDDPAALGDALAALADRARAEDRRDRAWRAGYLAAALADGAGRGELAAGRARRAHGHHAELEAETPTAWRAGLASDPEAQALARLHAGDPAARPARGAAPGAEVEALRLRRLLALSRRLNAEPSLDRLLDEVIDTAIELTSGERGFLLLARGPGGALEVVVARGFADGALADPTAVSRSIAARAVATCEPVITVDAGVDERFGGVASVASLRLRSVVAVPLRQKGRVIGCLYVDHRMRASAFDDEAAALVLELADIAAVAIENAALTADLRRQAGAIDELNQRLAATLTDREAELALARAKLPPSRDRLGPGLEPIIGGSPPILAMLAVVQRAAQVALPVVIVGESGTGKELVARALHAAGPRRDRPFVAVNCGAMPEPLLESELFGHVRGAFTGADRDRKGLFEIADGGTLFLDEIADTGPAMQAKLLRVLQDGVVRRVGDEKTHQVDVRVVAATQRPLTELSAAGRFRDDLRFRLEVITVAVPPLRARGVDLPVLVEHLLARLRPGKPTSLTRAAWRALGAHAWPGNVRELENALARAVALGGEVIDADDLPEAVAARPTAAAAPIAGDDLRLRPALETIERAYIAAALARAGGNQTVAARLLGLSRFGLQKKLRRQAEEASGADE